MQILFEEDGELRAGTVRGETEASLQVDTATGRRVKIRRAAVLLTFAAPTAESALARARGLAGQIDIDFLWQCAPQGEFAFADLAAEYFGQPLQVEQSAAVYLRLQAHPVYFQRRGRGQFRPAAAEVLAAALAGIERRRREEAERDAMADALVAGELPPALAAAGATLLTRPERNSVPFKAVELAAQKLQTTPLRLLLARGAIASAYAWHLQSFLDQHLPDGPEPVSGGQPLPQESPAWMDDGPPVPVFSIDDSGTTEIDDAFSVREEGGHRVIGVHIAAPGLGIAHAGELDRIARARLSTVYAPGLKFPMLPQACIEAWSLARGRTLPALSLEFTCDPTSLEILSARTCLRRVHVADNLRYDQIEAVTPEADLIAGTHSGPWAAELAVLWRFATALRDARWRERGRPELPPRDEPFLQLEGEGEQARVIPGRRRRDAALDRVVAELMIRANSHWGAWLEQQSVVAIYRSQSMGRVRMSTAPGRHEGLGASHYAWCTSPLRRYVDLVNQRQILAVLAGTPAPFARGDAALFSAITAYEAASAAYAEFQERMERYWSLRWLQQDGVQQLQARLLRPDLAALGSLPATVRLAPACEAPRGSLLDLHLGAPDLVELSVPVRVLGVHEPVQASPQEDAGTPDGEDSAPAAEPSGAEEGAQ